MNKHPIDPISLVSGIAFAGLGIAFLTGSLSVVELREEWLLPIALVAVGAALLISALGYIARERQPDAASEHDAPPPARDL